MSYPIVLSFNAHDPTGGAGIAADALTCASLEASAFTVATTLLAGDFSRLEAVIPLDADWVDDQARTLLEDSVVHAIKIGVLPDVQIVRVIAEIMADYPQVPVILAPSILVADDDDGNNAEDIITATHELILPNANLLIAQRHLLHLVERGDLRRDGSRFQTLTKPFVANLIPALAPTLLALAIGSRKRTTVPMMIRKIASNTINTRIHNVGLVATSITCCTPPVACFTV